MVITSYSCYNITTYVNINTVIDIGIVLWDRAGEALRLMQKKFMC